VSNPGKDGAPPRASARAKTPRLPDAKLVAYVQENPDFAKAYQAIAKQQQGQAKGQDLSDSFAVRACLAVLPVLHSRRWREEIWLKATGKSWKALTEFPRRLQKMAGEIESLNANFFSIPAACDNPTLVNFYQLPTLLRSYAEVLSQRTMRIPKGFLSPSRSRRLVELSHFAKAMTGRYCDAEIADLLNATAIAMGCDNLAGIDALDLAQARHRYRVPAPYMPTTDKPA